MTLDYGIGPPRDLFEGKNALAGDDDLHFFQWQIRSYYDLRRQADHRYRRAVRAYNNGNDPWSGYDSVIGGDDSFFYDQSVNSSFIQGIPYAITQTKLAALTPRRMKYTVRPRKSSARGFARAAEVVLNMTWDADERQRLIEKQIKNCSHTGLMVGMGIYDTDYRQFEKRLKKEMDKSFEESNRETNESVLSELASELGAQQGVEPEISRGEIGRKVLIDKVGHIRVSTTDYVADPDCDDFVDGPRWEGRRLRMDKQSMLENPRYNNEAVKQCSGNQHRSQSGPFEREWAQSRRHIHRYAVPPEREVCTVYEIFDYHNKKWKNRGGALWTFALDVDAPLEKRPNPYGDRPFVVEEWNGDDFSPFPQTDFDAIESVWEALRDIFFRFSESIKRAPNSTIIVDEDAAVNRHELDAIIKNTDGGIGWVSLGGRPISTVLSELATRQISPEYINAMNFLIQMIRLIEGLGPNQFGGGLAKSETTASEIQTIQGNSSARLGVKQNALRRYMNRAGSLYLGMFFRFLKPWQIVNLIGEELAKEEISVSVLEAPMLGDIDIYVESSSMAPESATDLFSRLQVILTAISQDPILARRLNRDAYTDLVNELTPIATGEKMFLDEDDIRMVENSLQLIRDSLIQSNRGSAPAPRGQSNGQRPVQQEVQQ